MNKRLYKTNEGAMVAGVCAGLGEYFGIDPTLIRLGFVVLTFMGGSGLLAYIVAAIVIPDKACVDNKWRPTGDDGLYYDKTTVDDGSSGSADDATQDGNPPSASRPQILHQGNGQALLAYILIGIGSYMLLDRYVNWYRLASRLRPFWPAALVILGLIILVNNSRKA